MGESDLSERLLSMAGKVNSWKMQSGTMSNEDRKDMIDASARINQSKLWVEDPGTITVSQIAAMCRLQARRNGGLDMLVIDYVQLIEPENVTRGESRQQQLGKITRKLKQLAKNQNLIVLSAAQLNRDVDRSGREPRLSDLREAGDIEQDTDVVMLCHMPGAENESKRADSPENGEECKVLVRKNRNGPTGEASMYYFRAFSLWGDTAENEAKFADPPPPPRFSEFDEYNAESGDGYGRF
jgi:replicative DNA helicase